MASIADGINTVISDDDLVDIYTLGGICLYTQKPFADARAALRPGTYVVVCGNISHKVKIGQ